MRTILRSLGIVILVLISFSQQTQGQQSVGNQWKGRELSESNTEQKMNQNVVFLIFLFMILGQLLKKVCKKMGIPYTPMISVLGLVLGIVNASSDIMGDLKQPLNIWAGIKPYIILFVFLPALIFESAFESDWHIFKMQFSSIAYLAGPALLLSTCLSALVMRFVLGYSGQFTFEAAVLFGAIISATDPVAVVALLKELGASRKLATLIEGESLFNDGTAYVVFLVLLKIVEGQSLSFGSILLLFIRLSIGGLVLGVIAGMVTAWVLKHLFHDPVLEVNTTLVSCYVVFYVAEGTSLHVSGILALVALGLYMTKSGKNNISGGSEKSVHHVWQTIQFTAETIIFILSGLIIGQTLVTSKYIGLTDYLLLPVLFIFLQLIRFGLLVASMPILKKCGYGVSIQEIVVMAYGGLRGAVGLCLALMVKENPNIKAEIKDIILFHTGGIALLTLTVNAMTIKYVVQWLGLSRITDELIGIMQMMVEHMEDKLDEDIQDIRTHNQYFNQVDWEQLKKHLDFDQLHNYLLGLRQKYDKLTAKRKGKHNKRKFMTLDTIQEQNIELKQIDEEVRINGWTRNEVKLLREIRHKYLIIVKSILQEHYEQGQCNNTTLTLLKESCDLQLDQEDTELNGSDYVLKFLSHHMEYGLLNYLKKFPLIGKFIKQVFFERLATSYEILLNFIEAHEEGLEKLEEVIDDDKVKGQLRQESEKQMEKVGDFMHSHFEVQLEEITRAIQQRRASYQVLYSQYTFIHSLEKKGQIEAKEADVFIHHIDKRIFHLDTNPPHFIMPDIKEHIIYYSELSQIFKINELQQACEHASQEHFLGKEQTIGLGKDQLVYLHKGKLVETREDNPASVLHHSSGQVAMIHHLLPSLATHFTTTITTGPNSNNRISTIDTTYLKIILDQNITRQQKLWKHVAYQVIYFTMHNVESLGMFRNWKMKGLKQLCLNSTVSIHSQEEVVQIPDGCIVLQGGVVDISAISTNQLQQMLSHNHPRKQHSKNIQTLKQSTHSTLQEQYKGVISSLTLLKPTSAEYLTVGNDPIVLLNFPVVFGQQLQHKITKLDNIDQLAKVDRFIKEQTKDRMSMRRSMSIGLKNVQGDLNKPNKSIALKNWVTRNSIDVQLFESIPQQEEHLQHIVKIDEEDNHEENINTK